MLFQVLPTFVSRISNPTLGVVLCDMVCEYLRVLLFLCDDCELRMILSFSVDSAESIASFSDRSTFSFLFLVFGLMTIDALNGLLLDACSCSWRPF